MGILKDVIFGYMTDETLYLWAQWGVLTEPQYRVLLQQFGDLKRAWHNVTRAFFRPWGMNREKLDRIFAIRECIDFHTMTRTMKALNIRLLSLEDADYPEPLKHIGMPPPFLFIRGALPPLHKTFAVVGNRRMSHYGRLVTEKFTADLVRNGFVIVSGLAKGVDQRAHEVTLEHNGVTLAVLGSGVDVIYPESNARLGEQILRQGGAILSEFPLGTPALKHHFPLRNRIIAGLGQGVLVTEAGNKNSGALITANYAKEHKSVFAVPSAIAGTEPSGTNHLIQQGAKLVHSVNDILEEYQMTPLNWLQSHDPSHDEQQILAAVGKNGKTIDELATETPYNVARLSDLLLQLCLKGAVKEMGRKWILL